MGDPREMAKWTHRINIDGELSGVGTEEDCINRAERMKDHYPDKVIEVEPMDGTEERM